MSDVFGAEYARAYDAIYRQKDYDAECDLTGENFPGLRRRPRARHPRPGLRDW